MGALPGRDIMVRSLSENASTGVDALEPFTDDTLDALNQTSLPEDEPLMLLARGDTFLSST